MSTPVLIVKQSPKLVKSARPVLPEKCLSALARHYSRTAGRKSASHLAQGEIDILEQCRLALGWPSILSLAIKYYALYPHRKCWNRALQRCRRAQIRTSTLNIKYLLLTVISCVRESLARSFNGSGALNRLVQPYKKEYKKGVNRLTRYDALFSPAPGSRQAALLASMGRPVRAF